MIHKCQSLYHNYNIPCQHITVTRKQANVSYFWRSNGKTKLKHHQDVCF